MKEPDKVPELDEAIVLHARAVAAGESEAAEKYVTSAAMESHRALFQGVSSADASNSFEELGRARIGFQYVSKMRFTLGDRKLPVLIRWKHDEDGAWRIAETEDLSVKRSPWSDIQPRRVEPRENRDA